MTLTKKLFLGLGLGLSAVAYSQIQPVLTGAPFLRISPDARAGGLGDQGVATCRAALGLSVVFAGARQVAAHPRGAAAGARSRQGDRKPARRAAPGAKPAP